MLSQISHERESEGGKVKRRIESVSCMLRGMRGVTRKDGIRYEHKRENLW